MEQPGLGDRLPFRGPTCGQATLRAVRGLPRAWRSPAASLLRMSRRPGPAAVSGSPAARRVACPGTYCSRARPPGVRFCARAQCQGPGEVDVGAGFRQLLLGLLRRLRAGDVDRTSAPRMADRAVDQGDAAGRRAGPGSTTRSWAYRRSGRRHRHADAPAAGRPCRTRTATCVAWLPEGMSLRGMQPAGIRGTWIRLCRLPADHP